MTADLMKVMLGKFLATLEHQGMSQQHVTQIGEIFASVVPIPEVSPKQQMEADRLWANRCSRANAKLIAWHEQLDARKEQLRKAKRQVDSAEHHIAYWQTRLEAATKKDPKWDQLDQFEDIDYDYISDCDAEPDKCTEDNEDGTMSTAGESTSFLDTSVSTGKGAPMHGALFVHANPFQALADQPASDKELHHNALMQMIQDKGMWSPELQSELELRASRIRAEQLAQSGQELAKQQQEQGHLPVTEVAGFGVPTDNF